MTLTRLPPNAQPLSFTLGASGAASVSDSPSYEATEIAIARARTILSRMSRSSAAAATLSAAESEWVTLRLALQSARVSANRVSGPPARGHLAGARGASGLEPVREDRIRLRAEHEVRDD